MDCRAAVSAAQKGHAGSHFSSRARDCAVQHISSCSRRTPQFKYKSHVVESFVDERAATVFTRVRVHLSGVNIGAVIGRLCLRYPICSPSTRTSLLAGGIFRRTRMLSSCWNLWPARTRVLIARGLAIIGHLSAMGMKFRRPSLGNWTSCSCSGLQVMNNTLNPCGEGRHNWTKQQDPIALRVMLFPQQIYAYPYWYGSGDTAATSISSDLPHVTWWTGRLFSTSFRSIPTSGSTPTRPTRSAIS